MPQSPIPPSPPSDSPGPFVKAEGRKSQVKGAMRERDENGNDDVIEILSDEEDLESLQVIRTTFHAFRTSDPI